MLIRTTYHCMITEVCVNLTHTDIHRIHNDLHRISFKFAHSCVIIWSSFVCDEHHSNIIIFIETYSMNNIITPRAPASTHATYREEPMTLHYYLKLGKFLDSLIAPLASPYVSEVLSWDLKWTWNCKGHNWNSPGLYRVAKTHRMP